MKRLMKYLCLFVFFFSFVNNCFAKELTIYFFYGDGCPHCAHEEVLLDELKNKYSELNIISYETWYNEENSLLMEQKKEELGISTKGVPFTIIGDTGICGYNQTIGDKITTLVEKEISDKDVNNNNNSIYNLPIIGKVDVKNMSLTIMTIVIGLVDGFNPCAMWVLLFLISSLLGMKNRKKMWILGGSYILTSSIVYMLIMFSWLEIVASVTTSITFRIIISIIAMLGGLINIRSYIKSNKSGCTVVNDDKRNKIFSKIKKFTTEKSLWLALIGIIGLAVSINIVELACSAGLPLIYTQILALNNVTGITAILYTLLYILFFMLDDIIIFVIAMTTLKVTGLSTKYGKLSHLIGGILMLLIGLLLIIKPEWIMLNF